MIEEWFNGARRPQSIEVKWSNATGSEEPYEYRSCQLIPPPSQDTGGMVVQFDLEPMNDRCSPCAAKFRQRLEPVTSYRLALDAPGWDNIPEQLEVLEDNDVLTRLFKENSDADDTVEVVISWKVP